MEVGEAQRILGGIVEEMRRLDGRLEDLEAALETSPQEERMLEGLIPPDAATEVRGAISYCRDEQLRQLIDFLGAASQVTDESLRHDFMARHAPGGTSRIH